MNRYLSDRDSDLDKRMSLIVGVCRMSLAVGTEVGIMTNGALVAIASDV